MHGSREAAAFRDPILQAAPFFASSSVLRICALPAAKSLLSLAPKSAADGLESVAIFPVMNAYEVGMLLPSFILL
jgi:hypothetical protein